ncbi:MAG: ATP-binding protein [Peptococcaceae bacterium]|nr:ATP-binding protein [Peptococcaceae bacterium]
MRINPFNPYFPAQDHLFANRTREQEFFRRGLVSGLAALGGGPWNIALLGPWGIGKTSLMRRFLRISKNEYIDRRPVLSLIFSATSTYASFDEFARAFIRRVADILPKSRLAREIEKWELDRVRLSALSARRKEEPPIEGAVELLYRSMISLWKDDIENKYAGLVVFIDDVHNLLEIHPKSLLALRTLFQDLQGDGAYYPLVVTGPETLFGAVREAAEPVTRFFERMPVQPFTLPDTAEVACYPLKAINSKLKVEDRFIQKLYDKTHGHPYFVSFVMRDMVEAAYARDLNVLTPALFDDVWPDVISHLELEKFEEEWRACSPAERKILSVLVKQPDAPVTQTFGKQRPLLTRLIEKGLVKRKERGLYELYHPLFAEFLRTLRF